MNEHETTRSFPKWAPVAGVIFGAATLLFFMILVVLSVVDQAVPSEAKFLVVSVLALGVALSSAFLGGSAAAKGQLPLTLLNRNPFTISAAGGVGAFVVVLLLGTWLYPATLPPGAKGSSDPERRDPTARSPSVSGAADTTSTLDIRAFVNSLSFETLLGQVFMVGFQVPGEWRRSADGMKEMIRRYRAGGVILYKDNLPFSQELAASRDVPQYVADLTAELQLTAYNTLPLDARIPLFVAADQEGAPQNPIYAGVTNIPDHIFLGAARSARLAYLAGCVTGREMDLIGVNMVLAPVADINNSTTANAVIGRRAFGSHQDIVTPLSRAFAAGLRDGGVLAVGKHYPGRGNATQDQHFALPVIDHADLSELLNSDLVPFRGLIESGIDGILTSHVLARPIDQAEPVTISSQAIDGLLRDSLQYRGLILSDDISTMLGVLKDEGGDLVRNRTEVAIAAIEAGHDVLIFGKIYYDDDDQFPERTLTVGEFDEIVEALRRHFDNSQGRRRLRLSVERIIRSKLAMTGVALEAWQERPPAGGFNDSTYQEMLSEGDDVLGEITEESVVLISENGRIVNDLGQSSFFEGGRGPLSRGSFLDRDDRVLVVSPVFSPPEKLGEEIRSGWLDSSQVDVLPLVYGYRTRRLMAGASTTWGVPVERYSYRDSVGVVHPVPDVIERRANEIVEAARDVEVVIMGVVDVGQSVIAVSVAEKLRQTTKRFIVLMYREPYLLPPDFYRHRHVTVLFLTASPPRLGADVLFGRVDPKPVTHLPVDIPTLIRRRINPGAAITAAPEQLSCKPAIGKKAAVETIPG